LIIHEGATVAKQYDLEDRTAAFARRVRDFTRLLPKDLTNLEYSRQLVRASGSVGANYIEANESLSKKDFLMRIKISRKEAKEARYWLQLIMPHDNQSSDQQQLVQEATELLMIFTAILKKSQGQESS
jgi:four helix bundle protein